MADTLLLMMFSWASKRGNICCGRRMFLKEIRNIFVPRTQILCPQQMLPAPANRETFVSATMCPQHCVLVCHHLKFTINKLMLVFYASVLLLMINCVITLSKCCRSTSR